MVQLPAREGMHRLANDLAFPTSLGWCSQLRFSCNSSTVILGAHAEKSSQSVIRLSLAPARSSMKKSIRKVTPTPPVNPDVLREVSEEREDHAISAEPPAKSTKYSSDESSDEDEEDTRMLEGNVYTKSGVEVIERVDHPRRVLLLERAIEKTACPDLEEERGKREAHEGGDRRGS